MSTIVYYYSCTSIYKVNEEPVTPNEVAHQLKAVQLKPGWWFQPSGENMRVSWDYCFQHIEKMKLMFQTTNSSIFIRFSLINHPAIGTSTAMETPIMWLKQ